MSRWPYVTGALSVGIFVFTGSGQGYNGGPLRNVTDLTPHCASCHSSMSKEDVRVEPEAFAACIYRVLRDQPAAHAMGVAAAAHARGFTWSTTAARLRRLYADLTTRALVDCA